MKYANRLLEEKIKTISDHFPVVLVTGARQVGKSTLLRHLLPSLRHITFDPSIDIDNARQDPDLFIRNLELPVILDEIQYAPELLSSIKRFVDKNKEPAQFFITGSQNFSVMRHVSESLAGRVGVLSLYPFSLSEKLGKPNVWLQSFLQDPKKFLHGNVNRLLSDSVLSIVELLWRGMYPGLLGLPNTLVQDSLDSYFRTYIERDIRLISQISDLQQFSRFAALLSNLTAQEINHNQLGRELGITSQTAKRWVDVLIGSYQWLSIPAFSKNTIKRISQKAKGYMTDTGMACYLMHIGSHESLRSHPKVGSIFESFVVQDIIKQLALVEGRPAIYHWRAYSGAEVDLLLEVNNQYFPIEIKYKSHPTAKDARGVKSFRESYPQLNIGPGLIIAPVDHVYTVAENCYVLPFDVCN